MKIEILNSFLCNECGSNCAVSEVVYGKIKLNMCDDCIEKKEEQSAYTFRELDEQVKGKLAHEMSMVIEISFDEAWSILSSHKQSMPMYDEDGGLRE